VVGIDSVSGLVELSRSNLLRDFPNALANENIVLDGTCLHNSCLVADGRQGYPKYAPYDAIYVGAAAFPLPKAVT
jgi:protein-L-isoaspartate(D-aspartate) O-methyltransferase